MKALDSEVVREIKERKGMGESLNALAKRFDCAKSTVSLYCRDLFSYRGRKYSSEAEARKSLDKKVPCPRCGQAMKAESKLCQGCYRLEGAKKALERERRSLRPPPRPPKALRPLRRFKPVVINPCSIAPDTHHHWILDSLDVGRCKWCGETKDFHLIPEKIRTIFDPCPVCGKPKLRTSQMCIHCHYILKLRRQPV